MSTWTRPSNVPFPSTWATFEGKTQINGSKRTYWIQDITEEYKDEIINHMIDGFMYEEPLCKYANERDKPGILECFRNAWIDCLSSNLGIVCLYKDENGKPTIAAMNCTTICTVDDKVDPNVNVSKVWETFFYIKEVGDVYNRLNVTKYLHAMGLYVLPEYRGEGLGVRLLKAREPLARACGLPASVTIYSSVFSQGAAERAGFKDLYQIDYDKLEKINPNYSFPGIQEHSKGIRMMYIEYK